MLNTKKSKIIAAVASLAIAGGIYVGTKIVLKNSGTKTYTLSNVTLVVSNSENCTAIFDSLTKLAQQPIKLEFISTKEDKKFVVRNSDGSLKNHNHEIVKQNIGDTPYSVGLGQFELDGKKVDYVITASTDIKNSNYQHLFPVIFASDEARCYLTALIQPSADATEDFIEEMKSGEATKNKATETK